MSQVVQRPVAAGGAISGQEKSGYYLDIDDEGTIVRIFVERSIWQEAQNISHDGFRVFAKIRCDGALGEGTVVEVFGVGF